MVSFNSVIFLLIAGLAFSNGKHSRIMGGTTTTIQKYPSVVQVESTTTGLAWSQSCAGTILNNRFILSAAQCFDGALFSVSRRRIRAGSASRGSGGVVLAVNRVVHHPSYHSSTRVGDLTIVETTAAWVWSTTIQPTTIFPQDFELPDHLPVIVAGWGRTSTGLLGGSSSTLREVTLIKENITKCAERYNSIAPGRIISENMLCTAGGQGQDSCDGDEGGPVFYEDVNGSIFLVGVISWRNACGSPDVPSVNTRVASYTNWIVINAS